MAELGTKLRTLEGGLIAFWCPGCDEPHALRIKAPGADKGWTFDGNVEAPTFKPSVLVRGGHFAQHHKPGDPCWCTYNAEHPDDPTKFECSVCHSHVTAGQIKFLKDSTHALAGKTVPLPDFSEAS